jgi:hypothetical protein
MINHLIGFIKPTSTRSAILSSCVSMVASKLAAKTVIVKGTAGWMLISGLLTLPYNEAANVLTQALISLMPAQHAAQVARKPAVSHKKAVPAAAKVAKADKSANPLYLHTFKKEYTCTFKGKVTCGEGLCNTAEVKVHLVSHGNPNIVRDAVIQPDGSYEVSLVMKEFINEHFDWWIVADSPDSASKQLQGREILMEDTQIRIEEPIRLL